MKAFLFGGDRNGCIVDCNEGLQEIRMPKEYHHVSYVGGENPFEMTYLVYRYIKYNGKFNKQHAGSNVVMEMEDLGIFIHDSFTQGEIDSLNKIISMALNANWKPVKIKGF